MTGERGTLVLTPRRLAAMRAKGMGWAEVAEEFGLHRKTLHEWRTKHPEWQDCLREMVDDQAQKMAMGLHALTDKAVTRFEEALDGTATGVQLAAADKIVGHVMALHERLRDDGDNGAARLPAEAQGMSDDELAALAAGGDDAAND